MRTVRELQELSPTRTCLLQQLPMTTLVHSMTSTATFSNKSSLILFRYHFRKALMSLTVSISSIIGIIDQINTLQIQKLLWKTWKTIMPGIKSWMQRILSNRRSSIHNIVVHSSRVLNGKWGERSSAESVANSERRGGGRAKVRENVIGGVGE